MHSVGSKAASKICLKIFWCYRLIWCRKSIIFERTSIESYSDLFYIPSFSTKKDWSIVFFGMSKLTVRRQNRKYALVGTTTKTMFPSIPLHVIIASKEWLSLHQFYIRKTTVSTEAHEFSHLKSSSACSKVGKCLGQHGYTYPSMKFQSMLDMNYSNMFLSSHFFKLLFSSKKSLKIHLSFRPFFSWRLKPWRDEMYKTLSSVGSAVSSCSHCFRLPSQEVNK